MPVRLLLPLLLVLGGCSAQRVTPDHSTSVAAGIADEHAAHDMGATAAGPSTPAWEPAQGPPIAPGASQAAARLAASPRHAEWVMVPIAPGSRDSIASFVVYPERRDNAPVVAVIHEIFGLSTWVRAVADQLAADGFIAIAPDLLSLERGGASTDSLASAEATRLIRGVTPDEMNAMVAAVARYGMSLPAAARKYGVVGYCWGGSASFNHAIHGAPGLSAAVVYYGSSPEASEVARVRVPVLGLYGENDQRVNATIARADSTMKAVGGTFVHRIYAGAGHGFLRQQENAANAEASRQAWPETIAWFRRYLQ